MTTEETGSEEIFQGWAGIMEDKITVTWAHLGPGAQNCHLPSKQWLLCQHERWATEPRKLKHRTVRNNHGKVEGGWNNFGTKAAFYNLPGYETQERKCFCTQGSPTSPSLKSESVGLPSKPRNSPVLSESRTRPWCQHSEIPSVPLSPDLQQRQSALRWGWREIPELPGNGVLKDLLLDQLINREETASDQKTVCPKASLCFLIDLIGQLIDLTEATASPSSLAWILSSWCLAHFKF